MIKIQIEKKKAIHDLKKLAWNLGRAKNNDTFWSTALCELVDHKTLHCHTINLGIQFSAYIPVTFLDKIGNDMEYTIPCTKLINDLKNNNSVELTLREKDLEIKLPDGNVSRLDTYPPDDFRKRQLKNKLYSFSFDSEEFRIAADKIMFAMDKRIGDYDCMVLSVEKNYLFLACTNRVVLAKTKIFNHGYSGTPDNGVNISRKGVQLLLRLLKTIKGKVQIEVGEDSVHITIGDYTLVVHQSYSWKFQYKEYFNGCEKLCVIDRQSLENALENVAPHVDNTSKFGELLFKKDSLNIDVLVENEAKRKHKHSFELKEATKIDIDIAFNIVEYLLPVVKKIQGPTLEFHYEKESTRCLFFGKDETTMYVVMPMTKGGG